MEVSNLGQLKYAKGSMRSRKRRGAGRGSGLGGTCGRGTKGQLARSGGKPHPWFEGGQMPLQRRLPKRGFRKRNQIVYQVVNVEDLERVKPGDVIDATVLAASGLVKDPKKPVKVLGGGEVKNAYSLKVTCASRSAVVKIQSAGGSVEVTVPLREIKVKPEPEKKGEKAETKKGKGSKEAKGKKAGAAKGPKGESGSKAESKPEKAEPKKEAKPKKAEPQKEAKIKEAAEPESTPEPTTTEEKKGSEEDSGDK
jgi:large subunit ribosomal protein L15